MATAAEYRARAQAIVDGILGDSPLNGVVMRMLTQESDRFAPDVVEGRRKSSAGAIGVGQFMPRTAANLGIDPLNFDQAVRGTIRYLTENIQAFGGDVAKGVAAYNAGPGNVQNAVARGGGNWQQFVPGETKQYLQIVQPSGTVDMAQQQGQPQQQQPGYAFPVQGYQGKVELHWGEATGAADLFAPEGTPVLAMTGGVVESVSNQGAGGNNVTIRGDDGKAYYFAHLYQAPLVKQGQRVEAGQQIGGVGDTGNAKGTGAHLHIGIGTEIQRGTGPNGGAGTDLNVTEFLTQVQSGTAPAPAPQGGTGMATTSATGGAGFAAQQLAKAKEAVAYWQQWKAEMEAKPASERSEADQTRLEGLDDPTDPEGHLGRALNDYTTFLTAAQKEAEMAPQGGTSGAQNAQAITNWVTGIGGYQNNVIQNAIAAANASTNLLGTMFGTQYDRATLVKDIFVANNTAMSNYLKDQVAAGNLKLDGAIAIAQTYALQQAAEATRATEVTTRAKIINDADFRNAERKLPPGTHYVPGLEPNGALAGAMQKIGLNFPGVGVTPTDWNQLDPRTSFADAEKTVKPVPDFEVSGVKAAAAENAGITPTAPTIMTQEGVGVPDAPDFSGIQIPQVTSGITPGEGGIPTTAEVVDMILGRGAYAPPPAAAPGTAPGTAPAPVTTPPASPAQPRPITNPSDTFAQGQPNQIPGTTEIRSPTAQASVAGVDPSRVNPPPYQPGETPTVAGAPPPADPTTEAIERIKERLRAWGLPVVETAAAASPLPAPVKAAAGAIARRFIR